MCQKFVRDGLMTRPPRSEFQGGVRPLSPENAEPGVLHAGNITRPLPRFHFWETASRAPQITPICALTQDFARSSDKLRVQGCSGNICARWFPERLRLPLQIVKVHRECGAVLDVQGRHRAACARSRRLRSQAVGPERTLPTVCGEAGATVWCNVRLRDMNVVVPNRHALEPRCTTRCGHLLPCVSECSHLERGLRANKER